MIKRLFESFAYTRKIRKISAAFGKERKPSLTDKTSEKVVGEMHKLWETNFLLAPLAKKYQISTSELEEYFWNLNLNGAGQWVQGYYVSIAALCYPVPLEYVLKNKDSNSVSDIAFNLLEYFDGGDPYLPV